MPAQQTLEARLVQLREQQTKLIAQVNALAEQQTKLITTVNMVAGAIQLAEELLKESDA